MIQDIYPSVLDNSYTPRPPKDGDVFLCFDGEGRIAADISADGGIRSVQAQDTSDAVYLFSVDSTGYFLSQGDTDALPDGYGWYTVRELRDKCGGGKDLFAAFTAYHLWRWYADTRFCGRCGGKLSRHEKERAMVCPSCGNVIYPRICPAVIVGVMNGDKLLITRYRRGYRHNALVAGFTEIGETLEQTVSREVYEETGIRVKNICYYKSQPWGMAQDMLVGFFCEAETDEIHMDENELKYAEWVQREDIVPQPNDISLTNEMMKVFKAGDTTLLTKGGQI